MQDKESEMNASCALCGLATRVAAAGAVTPEPRDTAGTLARMSSSTAQAAVAKVAMAASSARRAAVDFAMIVVSIVDVIALFVVFDVVFVIVFVIAFVIAFVFLVWTSSPCYHNAAVDGIGQHRLCLHVHFDRVQSGCGEKVGSGFTPRSSSRKKAMRRRKTR